MKISIISAFDPIPGDDAQLIRFATLAHVFARNDHSVNYYSSSFFHLNKLQRTFSDWQQNEYRGNIKLELIKSNSYKKNVSVLRLLNHILFSYKLKKRFKNQISLQKPDVVIVAFPPVLTSYYLVKICKEKKIPIILDVMDLWPDAFKMVLKNRIIYQISTFFIRQKRTIALKNASELFCVSDYYSEFLQQFKHSKHIKVVKLGINTGLFLKNISDNWNLIQKKPEEKWIVFLGTSGHIPDLMSIPEIAADMPGYRFLLLGRNPAFEIIKKEITSKSITNVTVIGNSSFHDIVNVLYKSDAALLFTNPCSATSLPNKLFYYFLAGLPVVANYQNSDLENLSISTSSIFFANSLNKTEIITSIKKAASLPESKREFLRNFAVENFDSETIYNKYYNCIREMIN